MKTNEEIYYECNVKFNAQKGQFEVLEPNRLLHELGIERCD